MEKLYRGDVATYKPMHSSSVSTKVLQKKLSWLITYIHMYVSIRFVCVIQTGRQLYSPPFLDCWGKNMLPLLSVHN